MLCVAIRKAFFMFDYMEILLSPYSFPQRRKLLGQFITDIPFQLKHLKFCRVLK